MNFDPVFLASARSDDELMERVDNREKYMPETIEASLEELQRRGKQFSDEELQYIHEDVAARRSQATAINGQMGFWTGEYKNAIVEDPEAPRIYSPRVIYWFTFLLGPLFGSIMMAMNLSKTGKVNAVAGVILFGIGFSIVQICLVGNMDHSSSAIPIICGIVGAYCLNYLFWRPYIGFSTFYRARPIWVPMTIGIILAGLILLSVIYGPTYNKSIAH